MNGEDARGVKGLSVDQGVDYASREEMAIQSPVSDEGYRDRGVPFSCCNLRAMAPCEHTEILDHQIKTINTQGCAQVVSPVLLRIVIVAYVMTSTLVIIQVFLAFLMTKVLRGHTSLIRRVGWG